jgi:hypothetical protein
VTFLRILIRRFSRIAGNNNSTAGRELRSHLRSWKVSFALATGAQFRQASVANSNGAVKPPITNIDVANPDATPSEAALAALLIEDFESGLESQDENSV